MNRQFKEDLLYGFIMSVVAIGKFIKGMVRKGKVIWK